MMKDTPSRGFPFLIILAAVAIVFGLQLVKWSQLTGDMVKDYDLLSDLRRADLVVDSIQSVPAEIEIVQPGEFLAAFDTDTAAISTPAYVASEADSTVEATSVVIMPEVSPRINGDMVVEDYTSDQRGLARLKAALEDPSRPARIAVIGDSYIEGDIFTQDLRQQLQQRYGGHGVGYVPAYSKVSGFRRTVVHNSSGWTQKGLPDNTRPKYFPLAGEYFTAAGNASISYKGYAKDPLLASWSRSRMLFIAPNDGKITMTTDNDTLVAEIAASPDVQMLLVDDNTKTLKINTAVPGLIFLGAWLEDSTGVDVDCMSIRGVSGMSHSALGIDLAQQMRQYTDYDLIILEYGINALTSEQHNYNSYGKSMARVVERVREAYPNADILMMGIGDRGQKIGGVVQSMPTAPNMVAAQRKAAQEAQCLFWDTREAMGGKDAIADWRERKLVNGDYIHLNSAGGKVLATELVESLSRKLYE